MRWGDQLILELYAREEGRCFYCDLQVSLGARRWLRKDAKMARMFCAATVDHIIPDSRGGSRTIENCVCACYGCNTDRADMPAVDFLYLKQSTIIMKGRS